MGKNGLKKVSLFFLSVVIFLVHLPFVFAKSRPLEESKTLIAVSSNGIDVNSFFLHIDSRSFNPADMLYDSLKLNMMGLSQEVFDQAMQGFDILTAKGKLANKRILSIVDLSLPSSKKRLFVIDIQDHKLLFNTYVAHGANSGKEYANYFSNTPESNKSSLGFYETQSTYMGSNGYSLKLEGLERGINDNAGRRAIVIHGAAYVSEDLIRSQGYIGRSWGCPALLLHLHRQVIDKIKNGTCFFIYGQNKNYLRRSRILNNT